MKELYVYLIYFIIIFLLVFVVDYVFIKRPYLKVGKKRKKKKNLKDLFELSYITAKFKLDVNKLPVNRILVIFSLLNAFIIAFTVSILFMIDIAFIWQFMIGFLLLLGLIYAIYELLGRFLAKKGWVKK